MTENQNENINFLTKPLSQRGWPTWLVYGIGVLGAGYLLNPGLGIFELFPDSIPIIGNLDEGTAAIAIWYGLMEFLENRRQKNVHSQTENLKKP